MRRALLHGCGNAMAQNSDKTAKPRGRGKPFQPGQSGNPGGRPATAKFSELVRDFLKEKNGTEIRLRQVLLDLQKNDPKILLHYAFGKPVEQLDVHATSTVIGLPDEYLAVLRDHAKSR